MRFLSSSPAETRKIAALLAGEIKKARGVTAFVVGLDGDLGAGKTTFIQGFARGLGVRRNLPSPTFLIMRRHKNLYHVDAYRLKRAKELSDLGFKEILTNPKNIIVVEWAGKIKELLPKKMIWIKMGHGKSENQRIIKIQTEKK